MSRKSRDYRGKQSNIFRLRSYLPWAIVHLISYRILMPASIAYGLLTIFSLLFSSLGIYVKGATIIIWIIFTPQIFAVAKGVALAMSDGLAFGHLNDSYKYLMKIRYHRNVLIYMALPYVVLALWLAGFIAMLVWWPV
ncbi:MAG: hypothetical protein JRN19_07370 [Nitrososphaerota archaeon]|nr:hypothetical protein [Nitrososphaerota archaeon]